MRRRFVFRERALNYCPAGVCIINFDTASRRNHQTDSSDRHFNEDVEQTTADINKPANQTNRRISARIKSTRAALGGGGGLLPADLVHLTFRPPPFTNFAIYCCMIFVQTFWDARQIFKLKSLI